MLTGMGMAQAEGAREHSAVSSPLDGRGLDVTAGGGLVVQTGTNVPRLLLLQHGQVAPLPHSATP